MLLVGTERFTIVLGQTKSGEEVALSKLLLHTNLTVGRFEAICTYGCSTFLNVEAARERAVNSGCHRYCFLFLMSFYEMAVRQRDRPLSTPRTPHR